MNLHEDTELFRAAVRATSEFKQIREVYIEKDYWVTYALKAIFKDVDATWVHLKNIYTHQFQHLVFGKFPDEQEIHASLLLIKNRLDKVDWDIELID